jgi:hypothetical protein
MTAHRPARQTPADIPAKFGKKIFFDGNKFIGTMAMDFPQELMCLRGRASS